MTKLVDGLSFPIILVLVVTLGLVPLALEPHIWEKRKMLVAGTLVQPVDIFDLLMHGAPWALLMAKLIRMRSA